MSDPFKLISPEYAQLLQTYLDDRCLEPVDFPLGLVPTNFPALLIERGYNSKLAAGRPFIFLEYLDSAGDRYYGKDDSEKSNPYALARFLGSPVTWRGDEPPPKVIAQNNRPNVLHYEPLTSGELAGTSWAALPDGQVVLHVESMVKAKAVHKWTSLPCIGLNGVSSFSSAKRGVRFLYEDQEIDFSKFKNVVLFDSNVWKPEVRDARERLMFGFKHVLGCKEVGFVDLPKKVTGEDQGPDDFIHDVGNGPLGDLIRSAEVYAGGEHAELLKRMDRAVFCTKGGTVVDREDGNVRSTAKARDFYATINEKTVGKGGKITTTQGYQVWLESPHRREVVNPAYEYLGKEYIYRSGDEYFNVYRASGPWPNASSTRDEISLIVRHLASIMKAEDLERLRSYAKFLKMSGKKPTSFPVIYSDKRGVGKGWFSKMMYRLVGASNSTNADAKAFVSNFNAQLANKRLVVINEFKVTGQAAKDAAMNSLKRFFGDEFISVEPKGVDSYDVENRAGMIITSNALEDVPTDGMEDRRMWYVECHAPDYEPDWNMLHSALDSDDVMNAIYDWVDGAVDIDFATWRPPLDEDRIKAIRRSSSGIDDACSVALQDARDMGIIVVSYDTLKAVLLESVPKLDDMPPRNVSAALLRSGWLKTPKRYGRTPAEQRHYYVSDVLKFEPLQESGKSVMTAAGEASINWLGGGKQKHDA
jgi:hypothetical protein